MGNNLAWTQMEEMVISLYDMNVLTLDVLDAVCEVYRGTDIDAGGSRNLVGQDGKTLAEIIVGLVKPEFQVVLPSNADTWGWGWYDEFDEITHNRWGWR